LSYDIFTNMGKFILREYLKKFIKSTQFQLICIIVFLLFIPGVLFLKLSFDKSEVMLTEKTAGLIEQNLIQTKRNLGDMFYAAQKLSSIASTDCRIMETLKDSFKEPNPAGSNVYSYSTNVLNTVSEIQSVLSGYRNSFFDYPVHTLVIASDGTTFSVLDGIYDSIRFNSNFEKSLNRQEWYQKFLLGKELSTWFMPCYYDRKGYIFDNDNKEQNSQQYMLFVRKIFNYSTQERLGISIVSLPINNLNQILKADKGYILNLINESGGLVYSTAGFDGELPIAPNLIKNLISKESSFLSTKIDGLTYMVNYLKLHETNGGLVYLLPQEYITKEITELRNYTLVMFAILFLLVFIIGINLILYITRPITRMVNRVGAVKIGKQAVGEGHENLGNLVSLEKTFFQMIERIEELVEVTLYEQQLNSKLQYDALCAQIHPHFLFNTLNSIKWSAMINGATNVADMIASLGELLEASLISGERIITLKRELELVEIYAQIKNWTLKYRFSLEFDINEDLRNCLLMKFSLQPIVENAIIHGIANNNNGRVIVRAKRDACDVVLQVVDNGKGMDPEKISKILTCGEDDHNRPQKFSGIGLYSIHTLNRISYGENYGISICSEVDVGTTVTLRIPHVLQTIAEEVNHAKSDDC
jgi:two-component system sensor histidine kinase YesM